jgi:sugar lactone lactonase YvrE
VLGGSASPDQFRRSLTGIATGPGDAIYVLGDDEVRIFDPLLRRVRGWRAPEHAACLAVGQDGRVYVGGPARVDVFDATGTHVAGFQTGEKDKPADVTAIKVVGGDILVADANARLIRRHGPDGTPRGLIGNQNKTGGFMLPNGSLDIAVDTKGMVYATDTGRHQVTTWTLDGSPVGKFGKFGMSAPEDFVGCCNPVNLALTPDGKIVTGEKMVARVKVFEPNGTLLAVIGPEHFDPSCVHIHLAVNSTGRILAADPVRREVKVFSLSQPPQQGERR